MSQLNGSGVVVQLSDGPHSIKFTINVLSDIEDTYGSLELFQGALEAKPFSTCRMCIHLLVPTETVTQAGDLMTGVDLKQLVEGLGKALVQAIAPNDPEVMAKLLSNPPVPPATDTAALEATAATPTPV